MAGKRKSVTKRTTAGRKPKTTNQVRRVTKTRVTPKRRRR